MVSGREMPAHKPPEPPSHRSQSGREAASVICGCFVSLLLRTLARCTMSASRATSCCARCKYRLQVCTDGAGVPFTCSCAPCAQSGALSSPGLSTVCASPAGRTSAILPPNEDLAITDCLKRGCAACSAGDEAAAWTLDDTACICATGLVPQRRYRSHNSHFQHYSVSYKLIVRGA
jgi:hypothetical protein